MTCRVAPAGLVSGPRKLKIVRTASSLRTGIDVARGAVVGGREHEAEADLVDAAADRVGLEVDAHAERLEHVGRARQPGRGAVAVLGDRAAGAGGDQRGGRGDVEGRAAAAGAGGVDQVVALAGDRRGQRRIVRARPTSSSIVSPFVRSAISTAAISASEALPSMISASTPAVCSDDRSWRGGERVDRFREHRVRQGTSPAAACRRA